jgi:GPH family glycoside/pentoside/hexuronide:cation symporter
MIGVSRLLDAFFDVVIGMTADRTKTRWGKFRPYLLWMAIPLAVSAVLAFTTPAFGGAAKIVYAYVTFVFFMFMYSAINIPYTAMLGVISGDPVERTSASSFKFIGAYVGGFIVSATALPLARYFGHDGADPQKGWHMTLMIYGVAAVILFLITFFSTHERITPIAKEKTSIARDLEDLTQNVPWLLLFAATILFILFVCIRLSVTTHYFKYYIRTGRRDSQEVGLINIPMGWFGKVIDPSNTSLALKCWPPLSTPSDRQWPYWGSSWSRGSRRSAGERTR